MRAVKFRTNETFPHETGNKQNSPRIKWITGRRRINCSNYKAVKNRHAIWTVLKNRQELKPILKHWLHQCLKGTKSFRTFLETFKQYCVWWFLDHFHALFWDKFYIVQNVTMLCLASWVVIIMNHFSLYLLQPYLDDDYAIIIFAVQARSDRV